MFVRRGLFHFNSTIVRLKPPLLDKWGIEITTFQFYNSSIKTQSRVVDEPNAELFQFYNSSIKTAVNKEAAISVFTFQFYNSSIKTEIINYLKIIQ